MGVVIQIDSREQAPLEIIKYSTEVVGLPVGDYGIRGFSDWNNPRFIVERKSLDDLVSSLTHGHKRFYEKEIGKLQQFQRSYLLIEANWSDMAAGRYKSQAKPQAIGAMIDSIMVRTSVKVCWAGNRAGAAERLQGWVKQFIGDIFNDIKRLGIVLTKEQIQTEGRRTEVEC